MAIRKHKFNYTLEERYQKYVAAYERQERKLEKQGVDMYLTKYNKSQYELIYNLYKDKEIAAGRKPTNVLNKMVKDQAYKITHAQATTTVKAIRAAQERGEIDPELKVTTQSVRAGLADTGEFFDMIKANYHTIKEQILEQYGFAGVPLSSVPENIRKLAVSEAKKIISREYYGSP